MAKAIQFPTYNISFGEAWAIVFTHMLNKLAVQYVMENNGEVEDA